MNRTRKLLLAGVGTVVVLVIAAMLLIPNLHTQAPTATTPPTNGAPGTGSNGTQTSPGTGPGSGTGSGNTSSPSCADNGPGSNLADPNGTAANATTANGTTSNTTTVPSPTTGNVTNGTSGPTGGTCAPTDTGPDSHGDQESALHRSVEAAAHAANELSDALVAVGQLMIAGAVWAAGAVLALAKAHVVVVMGLGALVIALVNRR